MVKEKIRKVAVSLLVLVVGAAYCSTYSVTNEENEYPGMIRLHIIANSNSAEDQALKLEVRNQLLKYMEGQESIEEARAYIDYHLDDIEEISEKVMTEQGYAYNANAERKVTFIPEKSYEDLTLPAGYYEALTVTLGNGDGENWWCVIFPQLCLVGEDSEGEKLILKSKIKELIQKQLNQKENVEI
ncbi:MAG: stage II sporulation protein R [Firmicutes bacterium]|nr:stage II sporulation protein R [Bacillota bacterium]